MVIPITSPETAKETLDEYQRRFLPESDSQLLRAQFACVVQLPNESVQKLHARMRVLYHLAYPDSSTRNDIFLIERFISALNNRQVQNHVHRRKPLTYAAALAAANEETSFVLMDLASHAPGGVQAPTPGDTSFITAIKANAPAGTWAVPTPPRRGGASTATEKATYAIADPCASRITSDCKQGWGTGDSCRPQAGYGHQCTDQHHPAPRR